MTRVSIVIPVHDCVQWLPEAVASALAQDHPDLEVLVVDDGSTDPTTVAFLDAASWPGVRVLRRPHAGQSAARNAGIAAATGEYILPLDSDDLLAPEYASRAAAALDADPQLGIVYAHAEFIGAINGPWGLPDYSLETMLTRPMIFVSSMFRKQDWSALGGFDEQLAFREDHDFWLRVVGRGRTVLQLDEILFSYRLHGPSVNSRASRDTHVATYARILQNNQDLYMAHSEALVAQWLERTDRLNDYAHRYRVPEKLIADHPRAYNVLRRLKRGAVSTRSLAGRAAAVVRRRPRT